MFWLCSTCFCDGFLSIWLNRVFYVHFSSLCAFVLLILRLHSVNGDHHTVTMLTRNEAVRDGINNNRVNPDYLIGAKYAMPENVSATSDVEEALRDVEMIVHTIPMQSSFEYLRAKKDLIPHDCPIVSASKGIHSETLCFMSDGEFTWYIMNVGD